MEKQNQQNKDQGFGIAALVIGVFATLFSFIPCVGVISIVLGILAIVFGAMSISKAQQHNLPKGSGIAGITLGGIALLVSLFWLIFLLGAKDKFKDNFESKFEQFKYWSEDMDDFDDEFKDLESLDDLERALDDLEGVLEDVDLNIDSISGKVKVNIEIEVDSGEDDPE